MAFSLTTLEKSATQFVIVNLNTKRRTCNVACGTRWLAHFQMHYDELYLAFVFDGSIRSWTFEMDLCLHGSEFSNCLCAAEKGFARHVCKKINDEKLKWKTRASKIIDFDLHFRILNHWALLSLGGQNLKTTKHLHLPHKWKSNYSFQFIQTRGLL